MRYLIAIAVAATALQIGTANAADLSEGKELHNENCVRCHGSEIYTRTDRRVTNRPGLTTQVQRCELALGLKWFEEDVEMVSDFLNHNFYKF
ncbi:green heme protein [Solemya pervernicosa gill symbiont]|uniref:Green heme protein n=2 Tax=Gammaproteobacteria incertae sedis TaxID=118884 RepID=A0A1T2L593_9GAMM|nr:green heme protein [Candidatus Reidiella endopervernicosa]OOZ40210.1 green heme protein [Solemya pervernicosa gill symbiont]QKQ27134.1 cytochrome c [Candidatus Reidiella endopervernicosa]